jgi:hypothetical protein
MQNTFMAPIEGESGEHGGQRTGALLGRGQSCADRKSSYSGLSPDRDSHPDARHCRAAGAVDGGLGACAQEWWGLSPPFKPTGGRFRKVCAEFNS